jgi:hypothetical protein
MPFQASFDCAEKRAVRDIARLVRQLAGIGKVHGSQVR